MNWQIRLKAKALRFFFDNVVSRKPAYRIDGVPAHARDEVLDIPTPHGDVRALLHRPAGGARGPLPVVVLIHGGGFVFGLPEHEAAFCQRLAQNVGCVVVNPDYALSPEHPFPKAALQCYEVVAWVARQAGRLGIDPARIAVGGHSAGGNLAAAVAAQAVAKGFPGLCLQIMDYPFLDGATLPQDKFSPIAKPLISPELATLFNRCYMPEGTDKRDPLLSPIYADPRSLAGHPPALVITAEYDLLRAEGDRYAEMLRGAGVKVRHEVFHGVDHSFTHTGPKEAADAAWHLIETCLTEAFASPVETPQRAVP